METIKKVGSAVWGALVWLCNAALSCLDWLATEYLKLRVK